MYFYKFIMTPHTLKMLTSFIFVVAVINSIYYAIYLTYDPAMRRMSYLRTLTNASTSRSSSRLRIPVVKVVWMPGPNNTRIKQIVKSYWVPEFSCSESSNKSKRTTVMTSETDYRDPDDYQFTEFKIGSKCPPVPLLIGPTDWRGGLDPTVMERVFTLLDSGGVYKPSECVTSHHVAVIVPYRGTLGPLVLFLFTLHLALLKQQIEYQVFVVRDFDESQPLNSGKFFNIGFLEAYKVKPETNWTCFVFHDPYLAPSDARNLYRCSEQPRQLFGVLATEPFQTKFGAVVAMRPEHFRAVNGFSNLYHDTDSIYHDMYDRLIAANYTIEKPSPFAKYDNLRLYYTEPDTSSSSEATMYTTMAPLTSTVTEPDTEGLSTLSYTVTSLQRLTHTLLTVDMKKKSNVMPMPGKLMSVLIRAPTLPLFSSTPIADDSSKAPNVSSKVPRKKIMKVKKRILKLTTRQLKPNQL